MCINKGMHVSGHTECIVESSYFEYVEDKQKFFWGVIQSMSEPILYILLVPQTVK